MDTRNNSWLLLCLLLFVFVLGNKPHDSIASDTISLGKSLTGNQTIISSGGIFELGFFKPGKSNNYYIGIWYKKVSVQTVVWVANRNKPISSYSEFKLIENGNLVIYQSKTSIWSTNIASDTSNTTEAVLGDDGNLVVRDGSNPSVVYWQSFDYPTDTWLPGGKVGFNKINKTQLLTSWRSPEDPAEGIFNLELDPNGTNQYLIIWNRSVRVWTTGEWNEAAKTFSLVPEMRLNYIYNYSYISNENESYFTYNLYNNSIISRLVMDFSGQIKQFTWSYTTQRWNMFWSQPNKFCDVYGICGRFGNCNQDVFKCECLPGFVTRSPTNRNFQDRTGGCVNNKFSECGPIDWLQDYTDGCARNATLQCGSKDWFLPIKASNLPDTPQSPQVNSAEECKSACESTCCNAYAYTDAGCKLWEGDLLNVKQESDGRAGNLYLRRAASEISSPIPIAQVRKRKVIIWKIIIPVFTLVATIMGVLGYIYLFKRSKVNEGGRLKELRQVLADLLKSKATYNDTPNTNMLGKSEEETQELQIFKLACLATATNNFCLKTKLGEGGFGPVYKGILQNGQEIAVKRLSKSSGQGIEEFKNEVVLISKLQHRNLVKLLGCCVEGEENMLIYEFMPNKSLDAFLFGRKPHLDWEKRFNIIGGIARGLLYLHRDSRLRVIHRDLKVSNILLDEDMNPKISDFGMARIFCGNQIIARTSRVVGTFGYMSPEYIMGGTFSEKSDVFSFGVLILEIVSSKKNNSFYNPEQPLNLLLHTWRLWNEGRWTEVIDEALGDIYSPSEVKKCVHIGLLCVQNRAVDRPTMAEVDFMLISETDRPSPKEPPYSFPVLSNEPGFLPIRCSNNNVTLTTVEGR